MSTNGPRIASANAAAREFAEGALGHIRTMFRFRDRIGNQTIAELLPALLAAMIDAAARVYEAERAVDATRGRQP